MLISLAHRLDLPMTLSLSRGKLLRTTSMYNLGLWEKVDTFTNRRSLVAFEHLSGCYLYSFGYLPLIWWLVWTNDHAQYLSVHPDDR